MQNASLPTTEIVMSETDLSQTMITIVQSLVIPASNSDQRLASEDLSLESCSTVVLHKSSTQKTPSFPRPVPHEIKTALLTSASFAITFQQKSSGLHA
jgi:hypothetical protein